MILKNVITGIKTNASFDEFMFSIILFKNIIVTQLLSLDYISLSILFKIQGYSGLCFVNTLTNHSIITNQVSSILIHQVCIVCVSPRFLYMYQKNMLTTGCSKVILNLSSGIRHRALISWHISMQ